MSQDQIRAAIQKCSDEDISLEELGLSYYVILTIDVPYEVPISWPCGNISWKRWLKILDITEGDEQYDYSYLDDRWEKGKHRKMCGILSQEVFKDLVDDFVLSAEDVETMGSLSDHGWQPAISFNGGNEDSIVNAYVTPIWPFQQEDIENEGQRNLLGNDCEEKTIQDLHKKLWDCTRGRVITQYK